MHNVNIPTLQSLYVITKRNGNLIQNSLILEKWSQEGCCEFQNCHYKFFAILNYHHSHFLAATLYFTSFFITDFLGAVHFFIARLCWIRLTSNTNCTCSCLYYNNAIFTCIQLSTTFTQLDTFCCGDACHCHQPTFQSPTWCFQDMGLDLISYFFVFLHNYKNYYKMQIQYVNIQMP